MVTLQLLPYSEIESLSSVGRIRKILTIAKQNKIVLLQGRLTKEEEAELIKATMEEINKDFKGIELAVIDPSSHSKNTGFTKFKDDVFNMMLGSRSGLTIVGPSSVVKQIKRNPNKIELLTTSGPRKKVTSAKRKKTSKKKKRR